MLHRYFYRGVSALIAGSSFLISGCSAPAGSRVELQRSDDGFMLLKNGEPYIIHGVGGVEKLDLLASYGGNTIRTWGADDVGPLLDEAHALGLSVVVGIWLEHQRHGFDYTDPAVREQELERVRTAVQAYKDHPALLAWGVGNEVELEGEMDLALRQINDAASLIKSLDPDHPRMAVVAEIGDDKAIRIQNECPDIDFLGVNSYAGLSSLLPRLEQQGYTGAYAITEFGPAGHWETGTTPWGAPYEQSSSGKADFLRENYAKSIESEFGKHCLGSFAFLWGHKQEKTATWYGLLLPTGETTESVDVLSTFWTGQVPANRAPRVTQLEIANANPYGLANGQEIEVSVQTQDPDGDDLSVEWTVTPESQERSVGGDYESSIAPIDVKIVQDGIRNATITMPMESGAYRIFATVRDGKGHGGTINLPVFVGSPEDDE